MRSNTGIILTRPISQAQELARSIGQAGGRAILFPALEIVSKLPDPMDQSKLDSADMAIFISANAVHHGLLHVRVPKDLPLAAIGQATAAALSDGGYDDPIRPSTGADSEALLAEPALQAVASKRIVIFRGVGGRETLRRTLCQRGAKVEYIECYTRRLPDVSPDVVAGLLAREDIAAVQALSRETLENFCSMIGDKGVALLCHKPIFAPHDAILESARTLGFSETIRTEFGDAGLLAALELRFC